MTMERFMFAVVLLATPLVTVVLSSPNEAGLDVISYDGCKCPYYSPEILLGNGPFAPQPLGSSVLLLPATYGGVQPGSIIQVGNSPTQNPLASPNTWCPPNIVNAEVSPGFTIVNTDNIAIVEDPTNLNCEEIVPTEGLIGCDDGGYLNYPTIQTNSFTYPEQKYLTTTGPYLTTHGYGFPTPYGYDPTLEPLTISSGYILQSSHPSDNGQAEQTFISPPGPYLTSNGPALSSDNGYEYEKLNPELGPGGTSSGNIFQGGYLTENEQEKQKYLTTAGLYSKGYVSDPSSAYPTGDGKEELLKLNSHKSFSKEYDSGYGLSYPEQICPGHPPNKQYGYNYERSPYTDPMTNGHSPYKPLGYDYEKFNSKQTSELYSTSDFQRDYVDPRFPIKNYYGPDKYHYNPNSHRNPYSVFPNGHPDIYPPTFPYYPYDPFLSRQDLSKVTATPQSNAQIDNSDLNLSQSGEYYDRMGYKFPSAHAYSTSKGFGGFEEPHHELDTSRLTSNNGIQQNGHQNKFADEPSTNKFNGYDPLGYANIGQTNEMKSDHLPHTKGDYLYEQNVPAPESITNNKQTLSNPHETSSKYANDKSDPPKVLPTGQSPTLNNNEQGSLDYGANRLFFNQEGAKLPPNYHSTNHKIPQTYDDVEYGQDNGKHDPTALQTNPSTWKKDSVDSNFHLSDGSGFGVVPNNGNVGLGSTLTSLTNGLDKQNNGHGEYNYNTDLASQENISSNKFSNKQDTLKHSGTDKNLDFETHVNKYQSKQIPGIENLSIYDKGKYTHGRAGFQEYPDATFFNEAGVSTAAYAADEFPQQPLRLFDGCSVNQQQLQDILNSFKVPEQTTLTVPHMFSGPLDKFAHVMNCFPASININDGFVRLPSGLLVPFDCYRHIASIFAQDLPLFQDTNGVVLSNGQFVDFSTVASIIASSRTPDQRLIIAYDHLVIPYETFKHYISRITPEDKKNLKVLLPGLKKPINYNTFKEIIDNYVVNDQNNKNRTVKLLGSKTELSLEQFLAVLENCHEIKKATISLPTKKIIPLVTFLPLASALGDEFTKYCLVNIPNTPYSLPFTVVREIFKLYLQNKTFDLSKDTYVNSILEGKEHLYDTADVEIFSISDKQPWSNYYPDSHEPGYLLCKQRQIPKHILFGTRVGESMFCDKSNVSTIRNRNQLLAELAMLQKTEPVYACEQFDKPSTHYQY